jgi:hypothetical protein
MSTDTFDRLARHVSQPDTRRAALRLLLGAAVTGITLDTVVAKSEPPRIGKPKGTSARRGKRRGKRQRPVGAQAKTKSGNHCVSPSTGVDLNEFFDISAQIVTSFCREVGSGEQWTVGGPWFMAPTFESTPPGFESAGDTPLEDFVAKFSGIKYVIDPGSKHQETVVFPNDESLFVDADFNGFAFVSPVTLGLLKPEPVGEHVVGVYWIFSAMHCDGIDDDPIANCLPAGETLFIPGLAFEVTPGHH